MTFRASVSSVGRRDEARLVCPLVAAPLPELEGGPRIDIVQGCAGGCCRLYPAEAVRVREIAEIENELRRALPPGRRPVFVGDADPLAAPAPLVLERLRTIGQAFPGVPLVCLASPLLHRRRTLGELKSFTEAGLRRVILYVGTGLAPLYSGLGRVGAFADIFLSAERIKGVGRPLGLGIVVSAGLEGPPVSSGDHVEETVRFLERLRLGPGDGVYMDAGLRSRPRTGENARRLRDRLREFAARRRVDLAELRQEAGPREE